MTKLEEIYKDIDQYLYMPEEEKGVLKLLIAFAIGCKLPLAEPPWFFLVSGSSNGKTQLLSLLELVPGYTPVDDLSGNALMSGMKRHDTNASLLKRLPKTGSFLVFSDFTVLLSKNKEEVSKILGQLRVVFDGKMTKHTGGQIETDTWDGKAGLLAASTTNLYTKTEEYAEVGQRMVIYHLPKTDNRKVGKWKFRHAKSDRKAIRKALQEKIRDYILETKMPPSSDDLPPFAEDDENDVIDIAHLAVTARSPVSRNKFSRDQEMIGREDPEGIGRVQGQLMILAYGLMVQNPDYRLTPEDRKLLFKVGLDCIDPKKREVMQTLTEFSLGGDIDQIATKIGYPKNVALRFVDDLTALGMLETTKSYFTSGSKINYRLKDEFKDIMMRFENIKVQEKALPQEDGINPAMATAPQPAIDLASPENKDIAQQIGF